MNSPMELLSLSALVHIDILLSWAVDAGLTIEQLADTVQTRMLDMEVVVNAAVNLVCASCGAGMRRCPEASALAGQPVYVCLRKCGYSSLLGGNNGTYYSS